LLEEAQVEDNPPVKLKNGFFAKLYEPIGELYMLPKYGELDLTPYFAPFYMLFFGLCLGDMGYGLTILIGAGLAKLKFPSFKSYLTLAQFLGVGAILMAALSGVFFGAKLQEILPLPDSITELFFSDLKMFWFAIIFGLVQIVFARMLNAIYLIINKGWQYGIHNIGWSIAIIWAAWMYATTMDPTITMPGWMDYIAICGAAMILFFSSDSGNIFTRLFKGVTAFYDVTSIFGDMLSYIRLFGLGTAGAILGMVVNSVAMSLAGIPYMGWFFALLMLIVGHIMVLLLSSLGAFVHPMRLTFVEFYKNAGFGGGGRAFRPMGKEIK
jgi:V/A-type H+-transporting ATPase subunit I